MQVVECRAWPGLQMGRELCSPWLIQGDPEAYTSREYSADAQAAPCSAGQRCAAMSCWTRALCSRTWIPGP